MTNNKGIQGNLFQRLASPAVNSNVALNAEWNSWGAYTGAGTIANVDADPWTHVDLYIKASGVVPVGGEVTYTVFGNFKNVMGAAFTLKYPTAFLDLEGSPVNLSSFITAGSQMFVVDESAGTISFNGIVPGTTPLTGTDLPIFQATFTSIAAGNGPVDLLEADDLFSMFPNDDGPSTNIYSAGLTDGYVTSDSFTATGTISMQGRTARNGVPATLTGYTTGLTMPSPPTCSATTWDSPE